MTLLFDSDNPDSIPDGVWAAGYVDGYAAPAWFARGFPRFPNAKRIAVFGQTNDGDCLDVERGDATPSEAPQWVQWRRAAGVLQPWVYCNRSNRSAVEAALASAGITASQVALWVATLDGTQTVPVGPYPVAAVQYANAAMSGGHYDLSLVNQTFGPGGGTIGDEVTQAEFDALVANNGELGGQGYGARLIYALACNYAGAGNANQTISQKILDIEAQLTAIQKSIAALTPGGTPTPTTVTLQVPAQTITGKLT